MNQESRKTGLTVSGLGKVVLLCSALVSLGFAGCCQEKPTPAPAPAPEGKEVVTPHHHHHE
jgi:hypothetical protein